MAEAISAAGHAPGPADVLERYTWRQLRAVMSAIQRRQSRDRAAEIENVASAISGVLGDGEQMKRLLRTLRGG
jgi:hypothetical protein